MKNFTKNELIGLLAIFLILIVISAPNFLLSLRRARDQVRRDDMGAFQHAMDEYHADFGEFPKSSPDGKLVACKSPNDKAEIDKNGRVLVNLVPCEWGYDSLVDLTPGSNKVYLKVIPGDPQAKNKIQYTYSSDGGRYQILASLEGSDEPEYDLKIAKRGVLCGMRVCNIGRSFDCPLDKSIQEYKDELERLRRLKEAQQLQQSLKK